MARSAPAPRAPTTALRRLAYGLLLVSPGLVPLVVRYLPFQDWVGHVGLFAVLVHWDDPAFQMPRDYALRGWIGPNRLFYVLAWPLGEVFGPLDGLRWTLALFLGGLAPAAHLLARSLGLDPRVAVLAPPLALGRLLLCGFAPNVAALTAFVAALAAFFEFRRRTTVRRWLLLVGLGLATLGLHVFVFLTLAGLLLLSALLDAVAGRRSAAGGVGLALAVFAPFTAILGRPAESASGPGTWNALVEALELPTWAKTQDAWTWLFASYHRSQTDDVLQAAWMAVLGLTAVAAWWSRHPPASTPEIEADDLDPWARRHVALWLVASLTVFAVVNENIGPPVNWWGASLRLPTVSAILGLVLAAPSRFEGRAWPFYAGGLVSAGFVAFVLGTTLQFERVEMAGFGAVVERVPLGATTCPLHETSELTRDFPGVAHGYVGNYVVAQRGGVVPQGVFGNEGVLFAAQRRIVQPGWGLKPGFSWPRHHRDCQFFLVRQSPDEVWPPSTRGQVRRITSGPTWTLYEKTPPAHSAGARSPSPPG